MYIDAIKEGAPFNFKYNGVNKVVIDEMFDSNLVKKHSYW
jgi:hypothetical protein